MFIFAEKTWITLQVDAHNIVPVWEASDKQEYAARTIRNKIMGKLNTYLTQFPPVMAHGHGKAATTSPFDPEAIISSMKLDRNVKPSEWAKPGTRAGFKILRVRNHFPFLASSHHKIMF